MVPANIDGLEHVVNKESSMNTCSLCHFSFLFVFHPDVTFVGTSAWRVQLGLLTCFISMSSSQGFGDSRFVGTCQDHHRRDPPALQVLFKHCCD